MSPYEPIHYRDLLTKEMADVNHAIDGVIPLGALSLLHGREKAGKSLLAIDWAAAVASGDLWAGREVIQGAVVVVTLEEHLRDVRVRLRRRLGEDDPEIPFFLLDASGADPDVTFSLERPELIVAFVEMIKKLRIVMAIIDPLREAHGLAENDSDSMSPLIRPLRQAAHQTNCAIVLLHHDSKSGGYRGSTGIGAAVDQLLSWTVTDPEGENLTGTLRISGRYAPRSSLRLSLNEDGRWLTDESGGRTNARQRILDYLHDTPGWHGASAIHAGIDDEHTALQSVRNALTNLSQHGDVARQGSGTPGEPYLYAVPNASQPLPGTSHNDRGHLSFPTQTLGSGLGRNTRGAPKPPELVPCVNCGAMRAPAVACPSCGLYDSQAKRAMPGMPAS